MLKKGEKAVVYNLKKHAEGQKRKEKCGSTVTNHEEGLVGYYKISAPLGRPDQINFSEGKN